MVKKIKILITLVLFVGLLALTSNSYSKYSSSTEGTVTSSFTKWQILLNDNDVSDGTVSNISFSPIMEANNNVSSNTIAPSSKGYFDIIIDPSNVGLSFKYTITLSVNNNNIPDLMVTKYSIIPNTYEEGTSLSLNTITDNTITNNMIFNKNISNFTFSPFTIRLYFEWYEGNEENMTDENDTDIGNQTIDDELKLEVTATISFEQIMN